MRIAIQTAAAIVTLKIYHTHLPLCLQLLRREFLRHACHPLTIAAAHGNDRMVDELIKAMAADAAARTAVRSSSIDRGGGGGMPSSSMGGLDGGRGGGGSGGGAGGRVDLQLTWTKPPADLPPGCPWVTPLAAAALGGNGECIRLIGAAIRGAVLSRAPPPPPPPCQPA